MTDRRDARVYPVTVGDTYAGTALIDSPTGVLAPGTRVSVRLAGQWHAAIVRAPGHQHSSGVCLELVASTSSSAADVRAIRGTY